MLRSSTFDLRKLAGVSGTAFIAIAFFLYWSCLNGAFIWDDHFLVTENLLIRSPRLIIEAFRHFLGYDPASNFYRPVQTLSYLFDYLRGGSSSLYYHQTNILIHGLNAALLFAFLVTKLRNNPIFLRRRTVAAGFLICLFWLVHPVHSATVAYIAGRADSLALLFILVSWWLWETGKKVTGARRVFVLVALGITGFLALCSKEAALAGLGFFILNVLFLEKKLSLRTRLGALGASGVLFTTYLLLRLSIKSVAEPNTFTTTPGERPLLILRALGDYLRLLVLPANLRMERQVTVLPNLYTNPATFDAVYPFLAVLGVIFLALLIIGFIYQGPAWELRRFGIFWFAIMLLPVSNVFSLNSTVAEHWLYLPSIGLCIALLGTWLELPRRMQNVMAVCLSLWIVGLSVRTFYRAKDWVTPVGFFEKTMRDGGDTPRMRINLANEYRSLGRLKEGEVLLDEILRRNPEHFQAKHALLANLQAQGRFSEAEKLVGNDENAFGQTFSGRVYFANYLLRSGQLAEAGARLTKLQETFPDSWLVTKALLSYYDRTQQPEKKFLALQTFARSDLWHGPAQMLLGDCYAEKDRLDEAFACYQHAGELDLRDAEPLRRAALVLAQQKRFSEAVVWQKKTLQRDDSPAQQMLLQQLEKRVQP